MFDKHFDPLEILEDLAKKVYLVNHQYGELLGLIEHQQRQLSTISCKINEQSVLINRQNDVIIELQAKELKEQIIAAYTKV